MYKKNNFVLEKRNPDNSNQSAVLNRIVHHHLIYQSSVGKKFTNGSKENFKDFLNGLIKVIKMDCLIPAQVELSHQNAWTGLVGIVTSHISFHYWVNEGYVQLDVYSCKDFDRKNAVAFISDFWDASDIRTLFIDRDIKGDFKIEKNWITESDRLI